MQGDYPGADALSMKKSSPFAVISATLHQVAYKISIRFHQACTFFYNSIRQKPLLMLEIELEFSSSFSFHIGHFGFSHCGGETSLPQTAHCCVFQLATKSWMNERGKSRFFHKTFKSSFLRVCSHFHSLYPSFQARSLRANLLVVPFYRWFCSQTFPRRHIFCEFLLDRQIFGAKKAKIGESGKRQSQSVLGLVRYQLFLWADWRRD